MVFGKLYGPPDNPRVISILVAAKSNNLDLELVSIKDNSNDEFNKSASYTNISPLGKIPAFEDDSGFALSEAIAIAIYITSQDEKTTLLGKTKKDYASILRWMSFANAELIPPLGAWYRPLMGIAAYNKKSVDDASVLAQKKLDALEKHLTDNTYLVGERVTLADLFSASLLTRAFATVLDRSWRSKCPAIARWFNTIINQPAFKAVVPNPKIVENIIQYTPSKKEEKKKEEKPAETKPEKFKHSLEALGKPTYHIDDWKRFYSNEETRPTALEYLWKNFNAEEYSLWRVQYKYNNELTLTFMANNLIGGFQARLEASRKYMFGAHSVYGVNNDCLTRGVYMIRGQDHLAAFDVAPDWENYDFKKLDIKEDREEIGNLLAWDTSVFVDGKEYPWVDGHVFK